MAYNADELQKNKYLLDIATALVSGSLNLFIGSGFSKHMTDGKAPGWIDLLEELSSKLNSPDLKSALFNQGTDGEINNFADLTVIAQILEDEFIEKNLNIREEIVGIVQDKINQKTINQDKLEQMQDFFDKKGPDVPISIVTTNYDEILNNYVMPEHSRVYTEGSPIAKLHKLQTIYHIHGSIQYPDSLVVTNDDYFTFQHKDTYMTRKFHTLLQEKTTVIIGYSLKDFNLNSILNESKHSKNSNSGYNDIYYISRGTVEDFLKEYYFSTFGITVIDNLELDDLFGGLIDKIEEATSIIDGASKITDFIRGDQEYSDEFLHVSHSFDYILSQMTYTGLDLQSKENQLFIMDILERKKVFTREIYAWDQYEDLAKWLIDLGSRIEINASEEAGIKYQELVHYSFKHMRSSFVRGYAWKAFTIWRNEWERIIPSNNHLIKDYLCTKNDLALNDVKKVIAGFENTN